MKAASWCLAGFVAVVATTAQADGNEGSVQAGAAAETTAWEFAITAYPTVVRGGENYTSAIATADRGPLHLEARYNYESVGARSAFVGWNFSGGDEIKWELTPLVGGAWGTTQAFIPGFEASASWKKFDIYVEGEFVIQSNGQADNYFYAWSELGFRPVEWLRIGIAGQRSRVYNNGLDLQRGPFGQVTWGPVTIGGYWFNPGSSDQVFVGMIGATF